MIVWPRCSQLGSTISVRTATLSGSVGQSTRHCWTTSSDSSSLGTNTLLASGSTFSAKRLTRSLKVAENRSTWQLALCFLIPFISRSESSAKPSPLSISSASSNTISCMQPKLSRRLDTQLLILPCVPMMIWCVRVRCLGRPPPAALLAVAYGDAVEVHRAPVYLAIFCSTAKCCSASSRVGARISTAGPPAGVAPMLACSAGSRKPSVLPEPVLATAMRSAPEMAIGHA
mmetsp:Transcript_6348/g.16149  ORF Transcript_6348/g.16149 Transcript_6348/m.16149 type:complete len:230 (+) Transcript_6348:657-1346(+)